VTSKRKKAFGFIIALGIVSLFGDMTYEGARGIIGPYFQNLGATAAEVGFIAGFGEMVAASLRLFSGKLVDRTRAYWTVAILGYFLNLVAVPILAFAGNWQAAALLVIAERTGKGLRGPAVDVLLSEATEVVGHGWGFGLHSAMDQAGAVLGPVMVSIAVARTHHFETGFLWLAAPAFAAMLALIFARMSRMSKDKPAPAVVQEKLPKIFWIYVVAAGLLALGFIDFPLLAFHFQKSSATKAETIPLLYAGAMGLAGLTALIFGKLYDLMGIKTIVIAIAISLLALPFGFLAGHAGVYLSVGCWATGVGAQDALLRPGIAQVVSMNKRGSAFGALNGIYGVLWFAGSAVMGKLYDYSIPALVVFGVLAQMGAAVLFFSLRKRLAGSAR
jgi:predicted MFS family arabinose efflux permease